MRTLTPVMIEVDDGLAEAQAVLDLTNPTSARSGASVVSDGAKAAVDKHVQLFSKTMGKGLQALGVDNNNVAVPTGTEDRAPGGMEKKWQRHYRGGKLLVLGKCCFQVGFLYLFYMLILWTQFLYPSILNSKVDFEAIIDHNDEQASDVTYLRWLQDRHYSQSETELLGNTSLYSFYVWHVTNPQQVMELGYKPDLVEVGPIGYVKQSNKYNVTFSEDDSQYVSNAEWHYYTAVDESDASYCKEMFFRMDKASLRINDPECTNGECDCVNSTREVTTINPPFMRLLDEYTPTGMLSALSQEAFEYIRDSMTDGFVTAVRSAYLPTVLKERWTYRKAVNVGTSVLRGVYEEVVAATDSSTAVVYFIADQTISSSSCGNYNTTAVTSGCPWGTGGYIASGDTTYALSTVEAQHLLCLTGSGEGCLFEGNRGMRLWVAAGRYKGYITADTMAYPYDSSDEDLYNYLVSVCVSWAGATTTACQEKVDGLAYYLFKVWMTEENHLLDDVLEEWLRGGDKTVTESSNFNYNFNNLYNVTCSTTLNTTCDWAVTNGTSSSGSSSGGGGGDLPSYASAQLIIDPDEGTLYNYLSVHTTDGLNYWRYAYDYCTADLSNFDCDGAALPTDAATVTLPLLLAEADGYTEVPSSLQEQYEAQVCAVADWLFGRWAQNNVWHDTVVASYLNETLWDQSYGYELTADAMEDIGYLQYATGAITHKLYQVYSISSVRREGIWRFMEEKYHWDAPEFWARAAIAGYPSMNITVPQARTLLNLLADDSDDGEGMRRFVVARSTSYFGSYGDGTYTYYSRSSSPTEEFADGDVLFVEENVNADFNFSTAGKVSNEEEYLKFDFNFSASLQADLESLGEFFNVKFESSSGQCDVLEAMYTLCSTLVSLNYDWPTNCAIFQTIMSAPASGIECDHTRIYDYAHPYPKQPGNVVSTMIYDAAWELVLQDGEYVCKDSDACDYTSGGMFVTETAHNILFGGYTDPVVVKILNLELASLNLTIECLNRTVVSYGDWCDVSYSEDCTEEGFQVVHSEWGTVLTVNRTEHRYLWYSAELDLPYGLGTIRNPAFAIYPGADWQNETYQRAQECEQKRVLAGDNNLFNSCETVTQTGRRKVEEVSSLTHYHGNSSLWVSSNATLEVDGGYGRQVKPMGFNGFSVYKVPYNMWTFSFSYIGSHMLGHEYVKIISPEALIIYSMQRDDGSDTYSVSYPTAYTYEELNNGANGYKATVTIPVNRYTQTSQDWLDARDRVGSSYHTDFLGMPYTVPKGLSSTMVLSGFPSFESDPHYYTNDIEGALDWNQVKGLDADLVSHASFVDVEPVTGKVLRRAIRLQTNIRMERSSFSPTIIMSQDRCLAPTKDMAGGYGCFTYVPLVWTSDESVIDPDSAQRTYDAFLVYVDDIYSMATLAVVGGCLMMSFGALMWSVTAYYKRKFDKRVYVD